MKGQNVVALILFYGYYSEFVLVDPQNCSWSKSLNSWFVSLAFHAAGCWSNSCCNG